MTQHLLASFSLLLVASAASAGDWTQFRGPLGRGASDDAGLPVRWSATEGLRWKVELPGRGLSNPVIAGGRVYLTASSGVDQQRLHVLCFDLASGKQLWERQIRATGSTRCHVKTCMAAPTPVTDGERVCALFATWDLVCLDRDGDLLWYRALRRDYPTVSNNVGMASSPVLWQNVLILQVENAGESFAIGIDTKTGQNLWKIERRRGISWVTPLVIPQGKEAQVLFQSPEGITACDPLTGRQLWVYETKGLSTTPSPVPGDGLVLAPGGELLALRPGTGNAPPQLLWRSNRLVSRTASPLYYQERVYALNNAGVLTCADAASGKVLWQERLKGPFSASLVAADGKIYAVNEEGTTFVVQTGEQPRLLASNAVNEVILATPAVADGALFLRSDRHLYCIGEKKRP
jgi:outer membrane protein assembly factor BamB